MSYLDTAGELVHKKFRTKLKGKDKYRYERGAKLMPYGLWRMERALETKALVYCEGETDTLTLTLWMHNIPALGIPGASSFGCVKAEHIEGIDRVYIVQEPEKAGAVFVAGLAQHLGQPVVR